MDLIDKAWAAKQKLKVATEITTVNKDDISTAISKQLGMTREQLNDHVQKPEARQLDILVAKVIQRTSQDGDIARLIALLSHLRDDAGNPLACLDSETLKALAKQTGI
jgi:iron-sulfur cluster repair protein YtfE (RIC family)